MIVRRWTAWASPEGALAYEEHFRTSVLPELAGIGGHLGAHLLSRRVGEHVELTVLTHWKSIAGVRAFAGHDENKAVVEPRAREVLVDHDPEVTHHEVVVDTLSA